MAHDSAIRGSSLVRCLIFSVTAVVLVGFAQLHVANGSNVDAYQDDYKSIGWDELMQKINSLSIYTAGEHLCVMARPRGSPARSHNHNLCYCDDWCLSLGDCCVDFADFRSNSSRRKEYACSRLGSTQDFFYTRSACSGGSQLEQLCRSTSTRDHLTDFPVFVNGTLYRNEYCALCELGEHWGKLEKYNWKTRIYWRWRSKNSPLLNSIELIQALALGNFDYDDKTEEYSLFFKEYRYVFTIGAEEFEWHDFGYKFNTVLCPAYAVVESCPNRSDSMALLCELYTAYVYTETLQSNIIIYRNAHCALCNGVPRHDLVHGLPASGSIRPRTAFDFVPLSPNEYRCPPGQISLFGALCKPIQCDIGFNWNGRQCVTDYGVPGCLNITLKVDWVRFLSSRKAALANSGTIFDSYYNITNEHGDVEYVRACTKTPITLSLTPAFELIAEILLIGSCVCLLLQIITYLILPSTRSSRPGRIIILLSTSIMLSHFSFLIKDDIEPGLVLCKGVAIFAHLCYISSFLWMLVMAVDSCRALAFDILRTTARTNAMLHYSMFVAIGSSLIVAAGVTVDVLAPASQIAPLYGVEVCWFSNLYGFKLFFALPVIIVIVLNLALFLYTTWTIRRVQTTSAVQNRELQRLQLSARLAVLIGLTWLLAIVFFLKDYFLSVFPALVNSEVILYLFFSLGLAQGVFIFVAFTCKKRILDELLVVVREKSRRFRSKPGNTGTSSVATTSSAEMNNCGKTQENT